MEMTVKKREWVKNAAIIFLAVMLVLTFFSNTIMNRSLPEVASQSVVSGEIVNKIRGTGAVMANESYEVTLPQSREIESVKIKPGDEVKEGDVLFTLSAAQSSELRGAQDTLRGLNLAYNKALIDAAEYDYAKDNLAISRARDDLQEAQAKQQKLSGADETAIAKAQEAVDKAQEKVNKAEARVDNASLMAADETPMGTTTRSLSDARAQFASDKLVYGNSYKELLAVVIKDREGNIDDSRAQQLAENEFTVFCTENGSYSKYNTYLKAATEGGYPGTSGEKIIATADQKTAFQTLNEDKAAILSAKGLEAANQQENEAAAEKNAAAKNLKTAQAELETAKANLEKLQSEKTAYDAAAADTKTAQRALEDLLLSLDIQKKADNKELAKQKLDLLDMKAQIASQQAVVGEIAKDSTETAVKAKVDGVVKSVDAVAGKTYDGTIATITLPEQGFCVSFSVTNEQARKVHTGDVGDISNYYSGEVTATLQSIKTDPQNPQNGKILVFDIAGDVTEGTNLTIAVGERSAEYDTIVPNSAIRSDANGDFVLSIVSKSSPLGNRYIATRVDVEKVASDDTNTAVSGALNPYDYVITTSSKPINNKDHVKLADA